MQSKAHAELSLLHRQLMAAQETYKEELKTYGFPYPLNDCIFALANVLLALNKGKTMLKVTEKTAKGTVDIAQNLPSAKDASEVLQRTRLQWEQRGRTVAHTGAGLIVIATPDAEEVEYKIELAYAA